MRVWRWVERGCFTSCHARRAWLCDQSYALFQLINALLWLLHKLVKAYWQKCDSIVLLQKQTTWCCQPCTSQLGWFTMTVVKKALRFFKLREPAGHVMKKCLFAFVNCNFGFYFAFGVKASNSLSTLPPIVSITILLFLITTVFYLRQPASLQGLSFCLWCPCTYFASKHIHLWDI